MKLSELITNYNDLCTALREIDPEDHECMPLEHAADEILDQILRSRPKDTDDIAALAQLARYMIQVEDDPLEALPLLSRIASWASTADLPEGTAVTTH